MVSAFFRVYLLAYLQWIVRPEVGELGMVQIQENLFLWGKDDSSNIQDPKDASTCCNYTDFVRFIKSSWRFHWDIAGFSSHLGHSQPWGSQIERSPWQCCMSPSLHNQREQEKTKKHRLWEMTWGRWNFRLWLWWNCGQKTFVCSAVCGKAMECCAHLPAPIAKALAHPGMSGLVYLDHLTNSSFFWGWLLYAWKIWLHSVMYVICQFFWAGGSLSWVCPRVHKILEKKNQEMEALSKLLFKTWISWDTFAWSDQGRRCWDLASTFQRSASQCTKSTLLMVGNVQSPPVCGALLIPVQVVNWYLISGQEGINCSEEGEQQVPSWSQSPL